MVAPSDGSTLTSLRDVRKYCVLPWPSITGIAVFDPCTHPQGGAEKLSDEDIEATLEKVIKLLAFISDKVCRSAHSVSPDHTLVPACGARKRASCYRISTSSQA